MSQEICRRSKTWGVGLRRGQLISGTEKAETNGGVTLNQALTGGTLSRWLPAALGRATAIAIAQDGPQAAATRAAEMLMFLLSSSSAGPGRTRQRRTEQRARARARLRDRQRADEVDVELGLRRSQVLKACPNAATNKGGSGLAGWQGCCKAAGRA